FAVSSMAQAREGGLLAIGAGLTSIPPRSLEQFAANARQIAGQITDKKHREFLIGCGASANEKACLKQFIANSGRLLYRRPLKPNELQDLLTVVDDVSAKLKDRYAGVEAGLAAMLESPQFLFRWERAEPDPQERGAMRLDAASKAARLSFFLWNS